MACHESERLNRCESERLVHHKREWLAGHESERLAGHKSERLVHREIIIKTTFDEEILHSFLHDETDHSRKDGHSRGLSKVQLKWRCLHCSMNKYLQV